MAPRTTIIVSPRERYSPTIASLNSLFASIPMDVPVIVVEGAFPAHIRSQLRELSATRPFRIETRDWPLLPNEARNIGVELVDTEFLVFTDNDMIYEPGWLDALESHADSTCVEVVAPLICIGPPNAAIIHHAGGMLHVASDQRGVHLSEMHNLMNRPIADLKKANVPSTVDTGEFHCIFVRSDFMRKIGLLDERLITREQNDFALRTRHAGGRVGFEPRAIVTYNAKTKLEPGDLTYHVFRWNPTDAVASLDAFESVWGVFLNRETILKRWIQKHRRGRIVDEYASVARVMGKFFVKDILAPMIERRILRGINRPATRRLPREIPVEERKALLEGLAQRPVEPVIVRKAA